MILLFIHAHESLIRALNLSAVINTFIAIF